MKRPDLAEIRKLVAAITANTTIYEGKEFLAIGGKYYPIPKNLTSEEFYQITKKLDEKHYQIEEDFFEKAPKMLLDLCAYIEELESRE